MLQKNIKICILVFLLSISLTSCFSLKKSPFYNSEWIMQNVDENGELYYHHLILLPNHNVMLRVSYADSSNIIVWNGNYKISSKKIIFNFTECLRYENGQVAGQYTDGKLIKYYTGDFYYSVAFLQDENIKSSDNEDSSESGSYHLALIRPNNYFYGEAIDIFGNHFKEFVKYK